MAGPDIPRIPNGQGLLIRGSTNKLPQAPSVDSRKFIFLLIPQNPRPAKVGGFVFKPADKFLCSFRSVPVPGDVLRVYRESRRRPQLVFFYTPVSAFNATRTVSSWRNSPGCASLSLAF